MVMTAIQTSWNGGELSRRMEGRVDAAIYAIGAAELTNMVSTVEGSAVKRPGFFYIRDAMASASWLIPFVFSRTQSYVFEFGDLKFRMYTNGGRIEDVDGNPIEVVTPYSAAEAPILQFRQSFDRIYIAHGSHPPAAITRTAATAFSHAPLVLENGPFMDRNPDQDIVVTISDTTGTTAITASCATDPTLAEIWTADHVGGLFRIEAKDFSDVHTWEPGYGKINIGDTCRWQGNVYKAIAISGAKQRTGTVAPTHTEGAYWDGIGNDLEDVNNNSAGGILWQFVHDIFGIVRIDTFISPTQVRGTVLRTLADSLVGTASYRWYQGAFSNAEGWPQSVAIWNSRLVFGKDFTIYGSVVGDYLNFADFTSSGQSAIDLSFRYTLSSSDPILWLLDEKNILIGTASGVYPVGAVNTASAPGPGNLGVLRPLAYGATTTKPQQIGSWLQFVQRGGRKIREGQYDFARDGYDASNSTVWCRHLTRGGIIQLAYSQEPEELTWALRADGVILAHPFAPEQQVKGWSPVTLGGGAQALSILAVPATDGGNDDLWALIERGGKREIWVQGPWWEEGDDISNAFFVDGGLQKTFDAPVSQVSAPHLAGQDVWLLADGAMFEATADAAGLVTLANPKTTIAIGLSYVARVVDMRPAQTQGRLQAVKAIFLRLIDSLALYAGSTAAQALDPLFRRKITDPMGGALSVFNGDTDKIPIPGGWDRTGQTVIESRGPFPWIVTARLADIESSK